MRALLHALVESFGSIFRDRENKRRSEFTDISINSILVSLSGSATDLPAIQRSHTSRIPNL